MTKDIDCCIDALHTIRLAQIMHGNGPQGHPLVHEAIKLLLLNAPAMSLRKKIADALVAEYGVPQP